MQEKRYTTYNKAQFDRLQKSLEQVRPYLETRRDFIQMYAEVYNIKSSTAKKQVKMFSKLLKSIDALQAVEFQHRQIMPKKRSS